MWRMVFLLVSHNFSVLYFTSSHVSVLNGKALNPKVFRKVILPT